MVDPEKDSYETIAEKWSAMRTDGGQFYSGHLDEEVLPFLPDGKAPENTDSKFVAFFKNIIRRIKALFEMIVVLFT